jgi:hypothetical protein
MSAEILSPETEKEEEIVAELQRLGVRYLSRGTSTAYNQTHPPEKLIAELTRQPSSRVRSALISLFLARPEYAAHVPGALTQINDVEGIRLRFFHTAAVFLQQKYRVNLDMFLPDLFSEEIGVSGESMDNKLRDLGRKHQQVSGLHINWQGTYENAAKHLFRQWELEKTWKK